MLRSPSAGIHTTTDEVLHQRRCTAHEVAWINLDSHVGVCRMQYAHPNPLKQKQKDKRRKPRTSITKICARFDSKANSVWNGCALRKHNLCSIPCQSSLLPKAYSSGHRFVSYHAYPNSLSFISLIIEWWIFYSAWIIKDEPKNGASSVQFLFVVPFLFSLKKNTIA